MHALRPAKKSRAIYHVRPSVDDRPEQDTIITRVVFQVCILHQHDLSGCLRKPASQRRSLALVRCLKEEPQIPQLDLVASILCRREFISICLPRRHVLQNLPRSVRRAIIHDDHFLAHFGVQHSPQDFIDRRFLVVNGNHDRHLRIVQRGGVASLMGHKCSKIVAAQPPRSKGISRQGPAAGSQRPFPTQPNPLSLWGRFYMPSFFIEQFGCRATQADGAALERQLLDRGCTSAATPASADIIVVNTCTVTASADAQARDAIRKFHAANPGVRIIATGCYAQRAPEELAALPGVTWVVGNSHKPQIPQLVDSLSTSASPESANDFFPAAALHSELTVPFHSFVGVQHAAPQLGKILTGNIFDRTEFLSAPVLGGEGNHTRPTLKIQDGCNSRCSYCVIPFVRGNSRSLPPDTVIQEIQRLSETGYREIVLSGINLGTYGRDLSPRVEFEDLLRRILDETSVERLRISSIEPFDVTKDLVDLFAGTDRIAQHFHMPLQSASDRILAAMHRWYRAEHYARRVELIHERLPHAAIGADVIAGFPGETEDDHAA